MYVTVVVVPVVSFGLTRNKLGTVIVVTEDVFSIIFKTSLIFSPNFALWDC